MDGEEAPKDVTEAIIDPSVTVLSSSNMLSINVTPWYKGGGK